MPLKNNALFLLLILIVFFQVNSCNTSQSISSAIKEEIQPLKLSGGSSGMAKLGDNSYLVVYDIKNFREGVRVAMVKINEETIQVAPITISGWGEEGISSDLESICKIAGKTDEYLIAESGNWKGDLGRIFHIKVDTANRSANILGITKLPLKNINKPESVGDQYESMATLPYDENNRILILAERGGSKVNPNGIVRWGMYNVATHQLNFSEAGMTGFEVKAPGNWTDENGKRDITDLHIDSEGGIWASASEDLSDLGPFYSVIYKIGQLDDSNKERPFTIYSDFPTWRPFQGLKLKRSRAPVKVSSVHIHSEQKMKYMVEFGEQYL